MRLTNQLRDQIISDVIKAVTTKDGDKLMKREQQLALQCYNAVFPKKIRDLMDGLPRGYLPEDRCLRFNIGGMNIQLNALNPVRIPNRSDVADDDDEDENGVIVKTYGRRYSSCERLGNIADEKLKQAYLDLHADQEAHKQRMNKIRVDTSALLNSVQTYAQLEKNWPEGVKFYGKYKPKHGDSQLPALRVAELNKTLGLAA